MAALRTVLVDKDYKEINAWQKICPGRANTVIKRSALTSKGRVFFHITKGQCVFVLATPNS